MENFTRTFVGLVRKIAPEAGPELEVAVTALAAGLAAGHVCVDTEVDETMRGVAHSLRSLGSIVGRPGAYTPLILDGKRLYLGRYWRYEQSVATALRRLAVSGPSLPDPADLHRSCQILFPEGLIGNEQAFAAFGAAVRNLAIISGGPGTGKTTTVTRILALQVLHTPHDRPYVIKLVAPTGKAADRLREAIGNAKRTLNIPPEALRRIPEEASTIHRLLGIRDDSGLPAHTAANPIHADLVVLDEASMVDLALMARLLDALPGRAALVLLGDKDQLDAVQPGSVFGDLCDDQGYSDSFLSLAATVLGGEKAPVAKVGGLQDSVFVLTRSYRFSETNGIGQLARAVNAGDEAEALRILRTDTGGEVVWNELRDDSTDVIPEDAIAGWLRPYFGLVAAGGTESDCFAHFARFRLLTPLRDGPGGVHALNAHVEQWLQRSGFADDRREWYPGKPVMITVNNYTLKLFNGDVGITLPGADGNLRVVFAGEGGTFRSFPPARLPDHECAYATTVHKSQGSEFDEVLLLLPRGENPVVTRNLLYTGITRARKRCEIRSSETALREGIRRKPTKMSGLSERLHHRSEP